MTTNNHHLGGNRLSRSLRPVRLAGSAAARWAATYASFGDRRQQKREQFVLRTAEDVTRTMGDMKGAFMKFGQILSTDVRRPARRDGRPARHPPGRRPADVLRPRPRRHRERVRRAAGDASSAASIASPSPPPPSARCTAPACTTARDVAVKVQYPGVREAIDHDLANVSMFMSLGGRHRPRPRRRHRSSATCRKASAPNSTTCARPRGSRSSSTASMAIPSSASRASIPELTTTRVLTQEYIEGKPFAHARTLPQPERDRIAEIIFRFCFGSIYRHRLFNGDPHPGNYLLCPTTAVSPSSTTAASSSSRRALIEKFERIIRAVLDRRSRRVARGRRSTPAS